MPELSESITAIREGAKEGDFLTYLTILQYHVTKPELLPTLNEVLEQDPKLAAEIGWDLVQMLLGIPGSETCLETVARLGNPREVVIKVMEALDGLAEETDDGAVEVGEDTRKKSENEPDVTAKFIVLLGMLAILHRRIQTKYPSRFLGPSLVKVFAAYQPTPEMTAALINLVRSLSGQKRPALPTRKSSLNVTNLDQGDASKNAPDPEAENEDPSEESMQVKLLQAFVTCVLQRYVNENEMKWAPRLLEYYYPEKNIPGRKTITQSYTEYEELHQRDGVVGNLVALARDLGLDDCSQSFVKSIYAASGIDTLSAFGDFSSPSEIHLSPGGSVCLIAYWMFSTQLFEADHPEPEMHIFPDHVTLLERFHGTDAQAEITSSPGVADALLAIGLGLQHSNLVSGTAEEKKYMAHHHHLTLTSVFHPDIQIRNAATTFAGLILHSDPDEQNRFDILEDLFENCMFSSLKACAVTWLKEEIIAAMKEGSSNQFSSSDVIDRLQYLLFPDESSIKEMELPELVDYWSQNHLFLLQVANFAFFLFSSGFKDLVPSGMGPAIEQRFVEPLLAGTDKSLASDELDRGSKTEIRILADRLRSIPL